MQNYIIDNKKFSYLDRKFFPPSDNLYPIAKHEQVNSFVNQIDTTIYPAALLFQLLENRPLDFRKFNFPQNYLSKPMTF